MNPTISWKNIISYHRCSPLFLLSALYAGHVLSLSSTGISGNMRAMVPLFSEKCNLPFRGQRALVFLLALSKVGNLGHKAHRTVEGAHYRDHCQQSRERETGGGGRMYKTKQQNSCPGQRFISHPTQHALWVDQTAIVFTKVYLRLFIFLLCSHLIF